MYLVFETFLWLGIIFVLLGYLWERNKHIHRAAGYVFFGLFWIGEVPAYLAINDYFNAFFTFIGLPAFGYLAYQEYLSKKWDQDPEVLRFLAGGVSIASLVYFGVDRVPILSGYLIQMITDQTVWLTNLLGYEFSAAAIDYAGNPWFYKTNPGGSINVPIDGVNITIVMACTGLQAMAVGGSFVYSTASDTDKKIKSLLILIPTIYIANLFRNLMVIYFTVEGIFSFEVAHNQIAKTFSVVVLIALLLIVFEIMPKFHENIMKTARLIKRNPIHQKPRELF